MTEARQWTLEGHSSQIADTGDYDGHYELTDGLTSLVTKDDICGEDAARLTALLNEIGAKWEDWNANNLEFELHLEKENSGRWKEIAHDMYIWLDAYMNSRPTIDKSHPVHGLLKTYEEADRNLPESVKSLTLRLHDLEQIAAELYTQLDKPISGIGIVAAMEKYKRYKNITKIVDNGDK